jgi:hypothetical protein
VTWIGAGGNSPAHTIASLARLCLIMCVAISVHGQVRPPVVDAPSLPTTIDPTSDSDRPTPPPTLEGVNDNANSVNFMDREQGLLNLGFELRGGWSDNLFNTSQNTESAESYSVGVPIGIRWHGNTSDLDVNYRIEAWQYPEYSSVNSISQTYQHQWKYRTSDLTSYFWNGSAGRVASLGQYLPVVIAIGSTGVAQSSVGSSVLENSYVTTSAASAAGFLHQMSEHDSISGTATAAWIEQAQRQAAPNQPQAILRSEPAGLDFRFDHQSSSTVTIGAEVTDVYIRGLAPSGHVNYTTLEATSQLKITQALTLLVAAGPVFYTTNSAVSDASSSSYSASATVNYATRAARISGGYTHVLQLGYLEPATTAHQLSLIFDRALTRSIDLTVDGRYVRTATDLPALRQSGLGITANATRYLTSKLGMVLAFTRFQQANVPGLANSAPIHANQFSFGITYLLGNPLTREATH